MEYLQNTEEASIETTTDDVENDQDKELIMDFAEKEMEEIDKNFNAGVMNAFGISSKEYDILRQIDHIGQLQVRAFLNSIEVELKYPNVFDNQNIQDEESPKNAKHTPSIDEQGGSIRKKGKKTDSYTKIEVNDKFARESKDFKEKEKVISILINDLQNISQSM